MMKKDTLYIAGGDGQKMKVLVRKNEIHKEKQTAILWIHGGGYLTGTASMVDVSCGKMLVEKYGGIVFSPGYRLSIFHPYPAALKDCYAALNYLWDHSQELNIDRNKIIVGGESAGGGLTAALCLYARDKGKIKIAMQIPLYPMLDCMDTESSKDNHGKVWNTRKNHLAWKLYLRKFNENESPSYASVSRRKDYQDLPDCYSFVCEGEPFYSETKKYIKDLQKFGIRADIDIYGGNVHAFDMMRPRSIQALTAREKLCRGYEEYMGI